MNLLGGSSQSRFLLLCFRMHLDDTCLCIGGHSSYKGSQASCTCENICRKATLVQPEVLVVQPCSQCLGLGHHRIQCLGSILFLPEGGVRTGSKTQSPYGGLIVCSLTVFSLAVFTRWQLIRFYFSFLCTKQVVSESVDTICVFCSTVQHTGEFLQSVKKIIRQVPCGS